MRKFKKNQFRIKKEIKILEKIPLNDEEKNLS